MKPHKLKVLKISELKDGGAEVEFGFDDDFVEYYENKFKKKLTPENFQKTMLEAMENSLEKEDKTIVEEKREFKMD